MMRSALRRILVPALLLLAAGTAQAAVTLEEVRVSDVTPFGFSVAARASGPVTPRLRVYADAEGSQELTAQLEIAVFPLQGGDPSVTEPAAARSAARVLRETARSLGLVKLRVHGCLPDTTYHFRLEADGGQAETAAFPAQGLAAAKTAKENAFLAEDRTLLVAIAGLAEGEDPSGWLVFVSSAEGLSPVTALVGDGASGALAYLNLGRLMAAGGTNWQPAGPRDLELEVWGPAAGPLHQTVTVSFQEGFAVSVLDAVEFRGGAPNAPPAISGTPTTSVNQGAAYAFTPDASDPEGDTLTFSILNPPTWASFDAATGALTGTPSNSDVGMTTGIVISVSDGGLTAALPAFDLTVVNVNDPPVASSASVVTDEDAPLSGNLGATDPDGDVVSFAIVTNGTQGTAVVNSSTGAFTYTPDPNANGTDTFTFKANDGALDSNVATVTVTVNAVNDAPVLASIGPKSVAEGATLTFQVTSTDPDATTPLLSATGLPPGATFDGAAAVGEFSWTPGFDQAGPHQVTFTARDAAGSTASETVTITVTDVNRPPVLAPLTPKTAPEGQTLAFTVTASDLDGDPVTLAAGGLPTGATFDASTGAFSWRPAYATVTMAQGTRDFTVTFTASDGKASDVKSVTITVTNVDRAPIIAAVGAKAVAEGAALGFTVAASDPDGDALTLSVTGLPADATFDPATRAFAWTPGFGAVTIAQGTKDFVVTFVASDGVRSDTEVVTLTVSNTNRPPVLAGLADRSVGEGEVVSLTVAASDPDGDGLTLSAADLPHGASFDAGSGAFSWVPDFAQAGVHTVTFTVTDGLLSDSKAVTFTVDNRDGPPVLAIGPKSGDEGAELSFTVTASDPDGDPVTLGASGLPSGATFDPQTGAFTWTPGFDAVTSAQGHRDFTVTFTASDGALSGSEDVTITVANVNRPPALALIGPKTVDEAVSLAFTLSGSDPDGDPVTYRAIDLPLNASFDPETSTFSWVPGYEQAGNYTVTFVVTDGGTPPLSDSEAVTITVGQVNRPPVLDPIGPKALFENTAFSLVVSGSDPDGNTLAFEAANLPLGATFDEQTHRFSWTPGYEQAGNYPVTFTVTDSGDPRLSASEVVTLAVGEVNRAPVLDPIGAQTVAEAATVAVTITGTDPDGNSLTFSTGTLPAGASFDPQTQQFRWTPGYHQAGTYQVTFTVTDNGQPPLSDPETVTITVTNVNRPPVLAAVGNQAAAEGSLLAFTLGGSDPDAGTVLAYSATGLPAEATLDPTTGAFAWTPGYDEAGSYPVTFEVSDGSLVASETVTLTVTNTDRPPALAAVGDRTVAEDGTLSFTLSGSDPDAGAVLTYSANGLPAGAALDPATGIFAWTPTYQDAGSYPVTFAVSDGSLTASEPVTITVTNTNRPPVLAPVGNRAATEGQALSFAVSATDPDGTIPALSSSGLPAGAVFAGGTFTWTPAFDQAGTHTVTFTASDGSLADAETINVTVSNVNLSPVLAAIGNRPTAEGQALVFTVSAMDPDGDPVVFSAGPLPAGAAFDPATRAFSWTPGYDQAGSYTVTFTASDGNLADSEAIAIAVENTNRPPVLDSIGGKSVDEGQPLSFTVSGSDPDGDGLSFRASGLPTGAHFDEQTRELSWTPSFDQAGNHAVTFTVTDGGSPPLSDTEVVTLTVGGVNRPPVLDPVGAQTVAEGSTLAFTVTVNDPDGDAVTLSAADLPPGADFDPGTGAFSWTPGFDQAGNYTVTFAAADSGAPSRGATLAVSIAVGAVNRPPVLDPVGAQAVAEGATLAFTVTGNDPDGGQLAFTAGDLPAGASFDPATQRFEWSPGFGAAGNYQVTFGVTDAGTPPLGDSEVVTLTVGDVNRPPVLDPIGPKQVAEGALLAFSISGSDPDGGQLAFAAQGLPPGAAFDPATATFSWTPGFDQAGNFQVTFAVSDTGEAPLTASETVTLTVGNANRPPVLGTVGNRTVKVGEPMSFAVTGADPDGDPLAFSAADLPAGASFDPLAQAFTWTPGPAQTGTHTVTFTVSDGVLSDSETVSLEATPAQSGGGSSSGGAGGGGGGCFIGATGEDGPEAGKRPGWLFLLLGLAAAASVAAGRKAGKPRK